MTQSSFVSFLSRNLQTDEKEILAIVENCKVREFKKETFLLREGDFCKHTFFVEKGLLKQFSIDRKGKEHIISFAPEHWFVTDRESAYFSRPSAWFIQAWEDSRVVMIEESFLQTMAKKFAGFTDFNNRLLHNHIRHLQHRIELLLSATAEERYLQFIKMYPDILLRVPQAMVASYLGITPESLSRVRRDLVHKSI